MGRGGGWGGGHIGEIAAGRAVTLPGVLVEWFADG